TPSTWISPIRMRRSSRSLAPQPSSTLVLVDPRPRRPLVLVVVVESGEPRRQSLDRGLELRVQVDEGPQLRRHPRERDALLATPLLELLDAAIGEVQGGASTEQGAEELLVLRLVRRVRSSGRRGGGLS